MLGHDRQRSFRVERPVHERPAQHRCSRRQIDLAERRPPMHDLRDTVTRVEHHVGGPSAKVDQRTVGTCVESGIG